MGIWYYILTPFTLLLKLFCQMFNSYGIALVLFALVVKVILFPFSLKGKRSMIGMTMLQDKMKKLEKQYGKDRERYNLEVQKLYEKEGVSPMGGCLWSMLPLFILFPLYAIIRQPLKYMMGMTAEQIAAVAAALNWGSVAAGNGWIREAAEFVDAGYNQLYLASLITPDKVAAVQAAAGETLKDVFSINFQLFGLVDLSQVPQLKFWLTGLTGFGLFLIPVISALTGVLFSVITMKTNNMNNQNEQAAKTNRTMMLMTPLMSLWIGFSMPAALSIYWIANNVLGLAQEQICGKLLKKDYERAAEEAKRRELEEKEEEKRLRRERAERKAREAEEARKNKGKKKEKPAAEEEKIPGAVKEASRVGMRQYARGRAYDPDRFGGVTPYHEDTEAALRYRKKAAQDAAEGKAPAAVPEPSPALTAAQKAIEAAGETAGTGGETPAVQADVPAPDAIIGPDGKPLQVEEMWAEIEDMTAEDATETPDAEEPKED